MAEQFTGCEQCKFHRVESSWVPPSDFNYSPKFLFVIEQFQQKSKVNLIKLLKTCEFKFYDQVEVAFLTRCALTETQKGSIKEGQKCSPLFADLLSKVDKNTIIVPMGATPAKVIAETKSIQAAHGSLIEKDGRKIIPTLHAGQVIAYPDSLPTFCADLKKMEDVANGIITQQTNVEYELIDTLPKFRTMIMLLWMCAAYSVDIETSSLDPHRTSKNKYRPDGAPLPYDPKILCFTFSYKPNHAFFLPWDHPEATWNVKEREYILKYLRTLLEAKHRGIQICHGGDFDYRYIKHVLGIALGNYRFDTLLAHYIGVTEEVGTHYLKILAWEFTDMGGYDDGLDAYLLEHPDANPAKGGSYQNIPLKILMPYACADADCTFRLFLQFKPVIDDKFNHLFYNLVMPAQVALADIENEGAPIDLKYWEYCNEEFPRIMGELLQQMRGYSEVIELEHRLTSEAKQKKIRERLKRYKDRSDNISKVRQMDTAKADKMFNRLKSDIERAKKKPIVVEPVVFNPKSPDQKQVLLYEIMKLTPLKRSKGWTAENPTYSTDKTVLRQHWDDTGLEIVKLIGKWTKAKTLYSMFVQNLMYMIGDDGRLRGGYNIAGTVTGRLSCSNPNLQQIPRNLKEDDFYDIKLPNIKGLFGAPEGYYYMQFDYSQAELRVLAALSREPAFLDAFAKDQDIHMRTASELFGRWTYDEMILISSMDDKKVSEAEKELMKIVNEQRQGAKTINFGLLYGQGAKKLARTMGWTEDQAKEFIKLYFKKLKRIRAWISTTKDFVRENGFSPSPYGRIRRLATAFSPEKDIVAKAERQAVNSPIQGTASDCMLLSLAKANTFMRSRGMKSRIVITVHDSAIVLVHKDEVKLVFLIMKKIMENPAHNGWLNGVVMKADAELGKSWGKLYKLKKVEDIEPTLEKIAA